MTTSNRRTNRQRTNSRSGTTAVRGAIRRGDPDAAFDAVRSYQDLIDANLAFLSGKLDSTPYHDGPVDPETVPLLGVLRKINQSGFVTITGQPALCEHDQLRTNGTARYDMEQISYLEGYLPVQQLVDFVRFMKMRPVYITVWNTATNKVMFSNQPTVRYVLSRGRIIGAGAYRDITVATVRDHDHVDDSFSGMPNISKVLRGNTVFVHVSGKNWCSGNVDEHVLEYFRYHPSPTNRRRPSPNRRSPNSPNRRSPNRRRPSPNR